MTGFTFILLENSHPISRYLSPVSYALFYDCNAAVCSFVFIGVLDAWVGHFINNYRGLTKRIEITIVTFACDVVNRFMLCIREATVVAIVAEIVDACNYIYYIRAIVATVAVSIYHSCQ